LPGMNQDCVFCGIIAGKIPGARVCEDSNFVAFLDAHPLFPGHVLLCPREHYVTFTDVPANLVGPMFLKGQLLTNAVKSALDAEGTFLAINNTVSQTVPHLHLHIVPRRRGDGLRGFFWPRNRYADSDVMEKVRASIEREAKKLL